MFQILRIQSHIPGPHLSLQELLLWGQSCTQGILQGPVERVSPRREELKLLLFWYGQGWMLGKLFTEVSNDPLCEDAKHAQQFMLLHCPLKRWFQLQRLQFLTFNGHACLAATCNNSLRGQQR